MGRQPRRRELWRTNGQILRPCAKSGIFLREITRRLVQAEPEIPDQQQRVNYILTWQVFGIGITQITSLLARRSVYCSKHATGKHSIAKGQKRWGNIWAHTKHTWMATSAGIVARANPFSTGRWT